MGDTKVWPRMGTLNGAGFFVWDRNGDVKMSASMCVQCACKANEHARPNGVGNAAMGWMFLFYLCVPAATNGFPIWLI